MEKVFFIWLAVAIVAIILYFVFWKQIAETFETVFSFIFRRGKKRKNEEETEETEEEEISGFNFLMKTEEGRALLERTEEGKRYLGEMALSEAAITSAKLNAKLLEAQLRELGLWNQLLDKLAKTKRKIGWRGLRYFLAYATAIVIFLYVGITIFKP
jgi:hypothetical protein